MTTHMVEQDNKDRKQREKEKRYKKPIEPALTRDYPRNNDPVKSANHVPNRGYKG